MQNSQPHQRAIFAELATKIREWDRGWPALSAAAGVDYYAVLRFTKKPPKNLTDNVRALCSFFGIDHENCTPATPAHPSALQELVTEVWDGSEGHAALLAAVIRSTQGYKVKIKGKD